MKSLIFNPGQNAKVTVDPPRKREFLRVLVGRYQPTATIEYPSRDKDRVLPR